ncbi:uncharacterized protein LOC109707773 [Ananas comosus]|uniref:Uncharacterized protein LOC109707773 n=1 Tax=Ananas comosus TaxID=4615 RepID=A0A6P5EMP1_ANACO|nr:uncharacterized protein LOC109707773 [Ananas comosus]
MEVERERALAALMTFKKFDPPTFDGEDIDPWTVELWIDSIETIFEDLYTVERDKIHLAVHCLQLSAKEWWKGVKRNRSPSLPPMTWQEFRELILSVYFPDSEKRKLRDRFQKLRQGDRLVREYEREFSRIVNCVPSVTFAEVVDRALWIEQGNASVLEECESYYKEKGKERPASGYDGQSSSQQTSQCEQREGKCFRCGQPGHARDECPQGASQALTLATAFSSPGQLAVVSLAARFGERQRIRQSRGSRQAASGRG